ncbi:MAG: hypothetical protein GF364_07060 [Candidatus Lokiarchaeota archaeon]|nr:hypothetical protein [Candidatus Lokiarchaeota archaeon]
MSKDELEPRLAKIMSDIAEVEGIIALDADGKTITGKTISEDMGIDKISKTASTLLENVNSFGAAIEKGKATEVTVALNDGFAVVVAGSDFSVVAFVDSDSKSQLALLARTIKNLIS